MNAKFADLGPLYSDHKLTGIEPHFPFVILLSTIIGGPSKTQEPSQERRCLRKQ